MCEVILLCFKLLLGVILGILSAGDIREKKVSLNALGIVGIISVCMACLRIGAVWKRDLSWTMEDIIGGALIGCIFLLISFVGEEKIGYGDSLLLFLLGIGTGGWNLVCLLEISSLAMAVSVLWMLKKKTINRKTRIAFYPFVWIGYVTCLIDVF